MNKMEKNKDLDITAHVCVWGESYYSSNLGISPMEVLYYSMLHHLVLHNYNQMLQWV